MGIKRVKRPHERLDVWQLSMDLVVEVYRVTKSFPQDEMYGIISQIRRAASSVPANIAEGSARKGKKELTHFLYIARGSFSELETHIQIALRLKLLDDDTYEALMNKTGRISAMLHGLLEKQKTQCRQRGIIVYCIFGLTYFQTLLITEQLSW